LFAAMGVLLWGVSTFRFFLALVGFWMLPLSGVRADGDAANGRRLAEDHCQRCHVVSQENRFAGINSTPSFMMLASLRDWEVRFLSFFERPPHLVLVRVPGVPRKSAGPTAIAEFEVTPQGIADLTAYAASLRKD